jgi:Protein of unknown function (DUF3309)
MGGQTTNAVASKSWRMDDFLNPTGTPGGRDQLRMYPGKNKCTGFACLVTSAKRSNSMSTILLILLVLLVVGALPTWPYSTGWGYYPSGGLGLVVVILLILVLMGRI